MKKILSITSSLILSSSVVTILANDVNNSQIVNKVNENNKINWFSVQDYNNNYFQNIKENYYKNLNPKLINFKNNQEVNIDKVIEFAKQKTDIYVTKFKNQNFNLNQIINTLSKINSKFAQNYNNALTAKNNLLNNKAYYSRSLGLLKDASFSSLESYVYNLKIAKTTFTTISAAAAISAAGFWAAAWWFGISIPWAIGSTAVSALAGGIAAGISITLVKYDNELSGIDKATISAAATYKLGHIFYAVLKPLLIGSGATATSLSWAFPAVIAIVPLVSAILAWINLFN